MAIVRIDSHDTHAWQVRISLGGTKYRSKMFSDGRYDNDPERSLEAAEQWEREERRTIGFPVGSERRFVQVSRSNTGVVGVSRGSTSKKGRDYPYYTAYWMPERGGKQKHKTFSIRKYGEDRARSMAIAHRIKMERKIHGVRTDEPLYKPGVEKPLNPPWPG